MAKSTRMPLSAAEMRIAHTKQKPKPRFVSKAHRLEQVPDRLEFDDVSQVLKRADSAQKRSKG